MSVNFGSFVLIQLGFLVKSSKLEPKCVLFRARARARARNTKTVKYTGMIKHEYHTRV